ncbi:MAG: acyl-CoA dehydrogenase family protein, partial [Bradyrhizobium sp.]|nr:acyl-CoA dehydrogenase family protein [Bradyrhizobium sp.]
MELKLSKEDAAFRDEVRAFIAENYPAEMRVPNPETDLTKEQSLLWHRILYRKGWIAPLWPKEYGGPGWSITQRFIFEQETSRAGTLPPLAFSVTMVGPVIYTFGNAAQKARFLPRILSGEDWWCQGYSEPGAGSDLAAVRTRAVRDGDHYVVNGHKTWTTLAQHADWIFCLVRTDPTAKKHDGISFILFDMTSKGVSTKPILLISGRSPFCETFFDNVRVPKANVVGTVNRGWDVAKYLLQHERAMISGMGERGGSRPLGQVAADSVGSDGQGRLDDALLRAQIATFDVDEAALAAAAERMVDLAKAGQGHPAFSSAMKYYGTELNKRRHEILMSAGGIDALEW